MTVKIVQGLINKADPAQPTTTLKAQNHGTVAKAQAHSSPSQAVQTAHLASHSDAVVTNISNTKSNTSSDKIKSHKEAKALSESVASKILKAGGDEHALGGSSGQVLL
ncbi:MAG: hypothetical protein R3A13_03510 [Bdellovibrionota bacterium]